MRAVADLLPDNSTTAQWLDYHVSESWDHVPEKIKKAFPVPPSQLGEYRKRYENWWYFAPPEKSFVVLLTINSSGQQRYVSNIKERGSQQVYPKGVLSDPMVQLALWGLFSMLIFITLFYWVFKSAVKPVQSFYQWASHLNLRSSKPEKPDFQFQELNQLSNIIHESIENISQALERESDFLSYASHELRTPIATLRTSITLLDKINPSPTDKEREVRSRIQRSSLTMKGITEVLLWLNLNEDVSLPCSEVNIEETVLNAIEELAYLHANKAIELTVATVPGNRNLPEAALNIVVTNIVRNAFQHTHRGRVVINQSLSHIQVINSTSIEQSYTGVGFGIGLKLIYKMAGRLGWQVTERRSESINDIAIYF